MAGEHRYSSSLFIQSGSIAEFKSGITASSLNIEGSVTADKYLLSTGEEITGGIKSVFFAGLAGNSTSGVSRSADNGGPESKDIFVALDNTTQDPDFPDRINTEVLFIEATGSSTFKPNFFNFVKLGDDPNIVAQGLAGSTTSATTVQQGSLSSYTPTSVAERQTGVHRYIIFAAETGSGGETHQVFHTVTIDAFSNIAPQLISPLNKHVSLSMAHDEDTGSLVLFFTKSFDPNQLAGENDFLTKFKVDRQSSNPPEPDTTTDVRDGFTFQIGNKNFSAGAFQNNEFEITDTVSPGLSSSAGAPKLHFTASVTNYDATYFSYNTIKNSTTQNQLLEVTLVDTNETIFPNPGVTQQIVSMAIVPPPTASIKDIEVRFEGSNNDEGFSNVATTTHTHTLLYDEISTLTSASLIEIANHPNNEGFDRYTSSLVRMRVTADINEPIGYSAEPQHDTRVQIRKDSSSTINHASTNFKTFKFKGSGSIGEITSSATGSSNSDLTSFTNTAYNITTESNGFTSFVITPTFGGSSIQDIIHFGFINSSQTTANRTTYLKHGTHDHIENLNLPSAIQLIINKCPDILVKNAKVEIQKGSKYWVNDEGVSSLSLPILYGLSSTIQSHETQSRILTPLGTNAESHPLIFGAQGFDSGNYITESIVRLRVSADIIEPFGPGHNSITATISNDINSDTATFNFHTGSNGHSSNFGYTTNHGHSEANFSGRKLLTGSYTSSWVEFNFIQGDYEFTANFSRTDGITNRASLSQIGTTTPATLDVTATPNTDITLVNHEVETFGYSGIFTDSATRDVLYGDSHRTNHTSESKSWQNHPLADTYASHSVTQYRVSGKIVEPFGPGRCTIGLTTPVDNGGPSDNSANLSTENSTNVVNSNENILYDNKRLVTIFTGQLIGVELVINSESETFNINSTAFSYSGPLTKEPNVFSFDNGLDGDDDQTGATLTVRDTFKTEITDIVYETETHGYSNVNDNTLETTTTESKRTVLYGFPHHTTADSSSFDNHPSSSTYASHSIARFRVRAKIIEPIGYLHTASRFEEIWTNNVDGESFSNTLHFISASRSSNILSSSGFDIKNRFTSSYTSSWIGRQLSSSINGSKTWLYTSGSILHEPEGENKFITSSHNSTSLVINDTEPTKITNTVYETETFGYSSISTNNEKRTILYGDNRITNKDSSSTAWDNHERADAYASQSVSRFRVRTKITEPLGPLHHTSNLIKQWNSSFQNVTSESLLFHTASKNLIISKSCDSQTRLAVEYTGSFDGFALGTTAASTTEYVHTGSITHEPEGENSSSFIANNSGLSSLLTIIKIVDTPPTQVNVSRIETETFGESNLPATNSLSTDSSTGISVGQQDYRSISRSISTTGITLVTGSGIDNFITASRVSRFRTLLDITEPVGPLHHKTELRSRFIPFNQLGGTSEINGTTILFTTDSAFFNVGNGSNIEYGYNNKNQLTASYTSSLKGIALGPTDTSTTPNSSHWVNTYNDSNAITTHEPGNENGAIFNLPSLHTLKLQVSSSTSQISQPLISKLRLEVETISGSGVASQDVTTINGVNYFKRNLVIPHGNTATLIDQDTNNLYPQGSSGSLVSVRITANVEELPQPESFSTIVKVGGYDINNSDTNTHNINLSLTSTDIESFTSTEPTVTQGRITKYTSSFFTIGLSASGDTSNNPTIDEAERKIFIISSSVISYNNTSNFDVAFTSEPSASAIFVTGALSSSTDIVFNPNITDNLNISSSTFKSGEEQSLYYVYDEIFKLSNGQNDQIKFFPTLTTTPPKSSSNITGNSLLLPISSEINLEFPNHLDIRYTVDESDLINPFITAIQNLDPSSGTGSILISKNYINKLRDVEKIDITTTITDILEGNGTNSITTPIFIIPAQPRSLNSLTKNSSAFKLTFQNNEDLGLSSETLYTSTLPLGLENYGPHSAGDVVNNIFITSQSNGGGNNYNISMSFSGSHHGDYNTPQRAFAFGDTGSLVVKVNEIEVVNASLVEPFRPENNHTNQSIDSHYNGNGWSQGTASFNNELFNNFNNKGRLILNKVAPFNNVSQSIVAHGPNGTTINYPNGYQAWNALIEIDQKLQEGYNKVEFEHRIFQGVTHSISAIDWFYDDGLKNPILDTDKIIEWSEYSSTSPTHSLSGISYFLPDIPFNISLSNIFLNLANKSYINTSVNTAKIERENSTNPITLTSDDSLSSFNNTINFRLNSEANDNGLILSNQNSGIIPHIESTGSIQGILVKGHLGSSGISNNNGLGELRKAKVTVFNRDSYTTADDWDNSDTFHLYTIGRFMSSIGASSTDLIEHFNDEKYRLEPTILTNTYLTNNSIIESVLTGSYDSLKSITVSSTQPGESNIYGDLQQRIGGELVFPRTIDTTSTINPNSVNYNVSMGSTLAYRRYYRAFQFDRLNTNLFDNAVAHNQAYQADNGGFSAGGFSGNSKFTVELTYGDMIIPTLSGDVDYNDIDDDTLLAQFGLSENQLPASNDPNIIGNNEPFENTPISGISSFLGNDTETDIANSKTRNLSICVRLPGVRNPNGTQDLGNKPGTGWGSLTSIDLLAPSSPNPSSDVFYALDTQTGTISVNRSTRIISIPGIFPSSYRLHLTNGVILMRIVIKQNFPGIIKKIELKPR